MQAVILAGGKGTRLKPYTTVLPKPLMPIGDYPILEVVIRQLKKNGFDRIIIAVGYHAEIIQAFFGNGEKWGVHIEYSFEDKPLGTAAPLRNIQNLDDNFLMMNGDILTDLDFKKLIEFHGQQDAAITIATHNRSVKIDYGTLEYDEHNVLKKFSEKPILNYNVSMGIYVCSKRIIDHIPEDKYFDFPDMVQALLRNNKKVFCYPYDGYWLDIGRPDDYEIAIDDFENHKNEFLDET